MRLHDWLHAARIHYRLHYMLLGSITCYITCYITCCPVALHYSLHEHYMPSLVAAAAGSEITSPQPTQLARARLEVLVLLDLFCWAIFQRAAIGARSLPHVDEMAASMRSLHSWSWAVQMVVEASRMSGDWNVEDVTSKYSSDTAKFKDWIS